jgi:predicted phage tail protein
MIKVNLHGKLGQDIGESWDLEVSSVAEALNAIEVNTKKLRKYLMNNLDYGYEILINSTPLFSEIPDIKNIDEIKNTELFIILNEKIETIDIVPCLIGADFFQSAINFIKSPAGQITIGALGLIGGVGIGVAFPSFTPLAVSIGVASIGLIAAGTSELLSKPPPNIPFTAKQADPIAGTAGGANSYLFNGPSNTVGEGGPVPVGYGTLLVGGNNVYGNYNIIYKAYVGKYDSVTEQSILEGDNQYIFNSRCYLISQNSLSSIPF